MQRNCRGTAETYITGIRRYQQVSEHYIDKNAATLQAHSKIGEGKTSKDTRNTRNTEARECMGTFSRKSRPEDPEASGSIS